MKTVVVNGANGYVASNFINKLLKQGVNVIALVRPNKKYSPTDRIKKVLANLNDGSETDTSRLTVYGYSLLQKDFSLQEADLRKIFRKDVDYFHFAASLKYDEKSVDEIFSTNIEGVENSISVFLRYATKKSRFMHISTAYSCGRFSGRFSENFYNNEDISSFRNYYEQSKRFAENIVKKYIDKKGLNAYIIRLSQVVGNNESGITKTDYGIFDFTKRMYRLAQRYPGREIRIQVDPDSTQNLIPVDTVVNHLCKVIDAGTLPAIMNFVSDSPVRNKYIIDTLNQLMPVHIVPLKDFDRQGMSSIERLAAVGMSFTHSYVDTNLLFETKHRDTFVQASKTGPDRTSVSRMLEYFINSLEEKKQHPEKADSAVINSKISCN